jgi:hypothetical protein
VTPTPPECEIPGQICLLDTLAELDKPSPAQVPIRTLKNAARIVVMTGDSHPATIENTLHITFGRALDVLAELERRGVVGPAVGSRNRDILVDASGLDAALRSIQRVAS